MVGFAHLGRLAQLGERLPYKQEVAGSCPASPTIKSIYNIELKRPPQIGDLFFLFSVYDMCIKKYFVML